MQEDIIKTQYGHEGIIVSVILLILLIIGYWIFNICNTESGEYGYIGKSCFEKLTEVLTDNYRIYQNQILFYVFFNMFFFVI